MRIACVGGGPAGRYFALLMKLRDPGHDITVFARGRHRDDHPLLGQVQRGPSAGWLNFRTDGSAIREHDESWN